MAALKLSSSLGNAGTPLVGAGAVTAPTPASVSAVQPAGPAAPRARKGGPTLA